MKYSKLFSILQKDGWYKVRQSGSHVILRHDTKKGSLTVPNHTSKEVPKGTLSAILKQADIRSTER